MLCVGFEGLLKVCLSKPWGFVLYWLESALFYPQEGRGHGVQLGELPQGASTSAAERDSIKAPREPLPVPLLPRGKLPCCKNEKSVCKSTETIAFEERLKC